MKLKIIKSRSLKEEEEVVDQQPDAVTEPKPEITFESNPLEFMLMKYPSLEETLVELLTEDFRDYLTGIYIMAPKPTVFKIVLHNNQYFYLTWMGKTYQAKVSGKKYYLSSLGDLERATVGIADLLMKGAPPQAAGPDAETTAAVEPETSTEEEVPTEEEAPEEIAEGKKKFKLNLLESNLQEAETGEAVLFESALVYAWYKLNKKPIPKDAILPAELEKLKSNPSLVKSAANAITTLKLSGGSEARGTGRAGSTVSVTPFWSGFGASNTTPKTDVILGNKKISVKAGNAQLMSGGKNESVATFYAAAKHVPNILKTKEAKDVISTFEKFVEGGYTKQGSVDTNLKAGKDKILNAGDAAHKEMRGKLEALFNKSPEFKIAFAKEAMSGLEKFGPGSPATADYVLSVDNNYGNPQLHRTQDDKYASKIADQMKLTVRFKSTSEKLKAGKTGRYRFWSVVSLISDPSKLKEGVLDTIKSVVNKVKDYVSQGIASLTRFVIGDNPEDVDITLNNDVDFS
jgi:Tfp pilus assembly protein PilV